MDEMNKEFNIEQDPTWVVGYNEALEWAAGWIIGSSNGFSDETTQFATNQAMTLRAAKREIVQMDFFDAVRNDPYMAPELKAYWLAMEKKTEE